MSQLWPRLISLVILNTSIVTAQSMHSQLIDPFFLIDYDPNKVHFDPMPKTISNRCRDMHDHYVRAWVYAHLKTADAEYFIVDGYIQIPSKDDPGASSAAPEEGYGFFIELGTSKCAVDPTPAVFFRAANLGRGPTQRTITISESALNAIAVDLIQRYAKAFGGKKAFLERISQQAREELPPVLRKQLDIFEKTQ
jgi:hypothetical protein